MYKISATAIIILIIWGIVMALMFRYVVKNDKYFIINIDKVTQLSDTSHI